jgi:hypothetical protein
MMGRVTMETPLKQAVREAFEADDHERLKKLAKEAKSDLDMVQQWLAWQETVQREEAEAEKYGPQMTAGRPAPGLPGTIMDVVGSVWRERWKQAVRQSVARSVPPAAQPPTTLDVDAIWSARRRQSTGRR